MRPKAAREAPLAIALLARQLELQDKGPQGGDGPSFRQGPQIAVDAPVLVASVTALTLSPDAAKQPWEHSFRVPIVPPHWKNLHQTGFGYSARPRRQASEKTLLRKSLCHT